ncbi:HMA2 domain-containing protein [Peribacillus loiseleuriae]|uniref:HMA2 domain-containing protein n=1 Tax=Peribacillus loiseleuriae TaxID=1679170 RepID=UPI0037F649F3
MRPKFHILHDIPGRLRVHIPALGKNQDYEEIQTIISSLRGIQDVRIQPIIQTMLIQYKSDEISRTQLLRCVSLFFHQQPVNPLDNLMLHVKPKVRGDLFRSLVAGGLLLFAFIQNASFKKPTVLAYGAVIATGYAVLSHGTNNKLRHPDILTGLLSLGSLGPANMLHGAMVTWAVNVLELLHEMRDEKKVYPLSDIFSYRSV